MSCENDWLAKPQETQPRILEWARRFPDLVELDSVKQFAGFDVFVITVTDRTVPGEGKRKGLFTLNLMPMSRPPRRLA